MSDRSRNRSQHPADPDGVFERRIQSVDDRARIDVRQFLHDEEQARLTVEECVTDQGRISLNHFGHITQG